MTTIRAKGDAAGEALRERRWRRRISRRADVRRSWRGSRFRRRNSRGTPFPCVWRGAKIPCDSVSMNAREWSLRIADLARRENCSLVDLLLALAEFDRLGVWRQLGHASLFDFLHREVGLSRGSAYYRQVAARLLGRFPELAEPLRDGRLCVSNVPQLAKVITDENRATVPARFFRCSKEEARQVVAEILPAEVVLTRTVVTVVPLLAPVAPAPVSVQLVGRDRAHPGRVQAPAEFASSVPEVRRTIVEPLTRTETRMHVTVSPAFLALLKKARAGQSHVRPGATDEQVLTSALELLIAQQEKRRASVPPKVKREVMKRDGGKCTWPLANGGTCGSEVRTEIDHVLPRGKGGPSTVENCRVLCDVHNREAARREYGDDLVDRYARNPVAGEDCAGYGVPRAARPARASPSAGSIASAARNAARASSARPSFARCCPWAVARRACSGARRRAAASVPMAPARSPSDAWKRA